MLQQSIFRPYSLAQIITLIVTILLFNTVTPAVVSAFNLNSTSDITSSSNKILICTQNGYKWVTVNTNNDALTATDSVNELANNLNDFNQSFTADTEVFDLLSSGKCPLCFIELAALSALSSSELALPFYFVQTRSLPASDFSTLAEPYFLNPITRAPPFSIKT